MATWGTMPRRLRRQQSIFIALYIAYSAISLDPNGFASAAGQDVCQVRLHSICFTVNGCLCVSALASNSGDVLPLVQVKRMTKLKLTIVNLLSYQQISRCQ